MKDWAAKVSERQSIARRMTLSLAVTVCVVSFIAVATAYRVIVRTEHANLEQHADQTLSYLVGSLEGPLWAVDHAGVQAIGAALVRDERVVALTIRDEGGAPVYVMAKRNDGAAIVRSGKIYRRRGDVSRFVGDVSLSVAADRIDPVNRKLLASSLFTVLLILVAIVGVAIYYIRAALMRPVARLNEIVAAFAAGNYAASRQSMPYVEFQPFGRALADMAGEIEGQMRRVREAEAKYRSIFDNASEGIFQASPDGRLLSGNPALAAIFGFASLDALFAHGGTALDLYVDPEDRQRFLAALIEQGRITDFQTRFRRVDGQIIWVSLNARLVREDGKPSLIEGFVSDVSDRKRAEADLQQSEAELLRVNGELRASLFDAVSAVAATVEMRDPYTAGHQRRVSQLAAAIGREMGLPEMQLEGVHLAGVVHDVGKIKIPSETLTKPGALSAIEFALIREHSQTGYDILKGINFPWPIAEMVLQHHERVDGTGYPLGLKGDEILAEAQIIAVADVVEAMMSDRPYRPGLGIDAALNEISTKRGTAFRADIVDACIALFREKGFSLER